MTFLQRHFRLYNRRYFGNRLPNVPVNWHRLMPNSLGLSSDDWIWIDSGLSKYKVHALLVLLHEMIHLKLKIRHPLHWHGPRFQREMLRLARLGALRSLF